MDPSETPATDPDVGSAERISDSSFKAWLEGCLGKQPPAFPLKKVAAVALNESAVDDATTEALGAALLSRDGDLSVSGGMALSMLRHHGQRRLCSSVCRVILARLRMQEATRELGNALGAVQLDELTLCNTTRSAAVRLATTSRATDAALPQAETNTRKSHSSASRKFAHAALQVSLAVSFLQRRLAADAAGRLFLEEVSAAKPSRGLPGPTGLAALLKSKPATAAPIAEAFHAELRAFELESQRARTEERLSRDRAHHLETEVESLRKAASDLANRLHLRDAEVAALRSRIEDEDRLARDREETLRARVSRRLKSDVAMLQEGLDALRREPPRVKVMEDHADRVYESLRRELEQLETGGTP